jgi:hypothetical protein
MGKKPGTMLHPLTLGIGPRAWFESHQEDDSATGNIQWA